MNQIQSGKQMSIDPIDTLNDPRVKSYLLERIS